MRNFEVQHTLRLYEPNLAAAIGTMFGLKRNTYRNKNEFLTDIVRLGLKEMEKTHAGPSPATQKTPESIAEDLKEILTVLTEITDYITVQFKRANINHRVLECLLSSVYYLLIGINDGEQLLSDKVNSGFYDDLPARFEKVVIRLDQRYGLK